MYPASLEKLIECFRKLPGVGAKTAERYALLISEMEESQVREFAEALIDVKEKLHHCSICGNLSEGEECSICSDPDRNHKQIFVVQSPKDVIAMENTGEYHGVYHVLNGLISSTKGIMPEDLNLDLLVERAMHAEEVIIATNATMDGETTAMYLDRLLKQKCPGLLVTRIAHGLPAGGMLDYADEMTLSHALSDRRKM
ncbi:recombination protein RecR [Erysipelotrichaceae bacterium Oil+RF-744-GAM-WT-6]|jgi:recombination protein RecR|uniref:Recombination protein RecR n=1 Tax=Stecheria intestinalis TaxID=2606630 RepID=A0A7X2TGF4_9FIRM|nr:MULTISPECIES: recombination mediator RecR [Erysipelotrichaceae]MCI2154866.1 recombination mediator RecR [Solobacterium sp.]MDY3233169.1 recombination mediator RecR [Erysipelotrichaceae bacterium]MCI6746927.1 recombination mediator RecR [Anaerolactibacter massiliensis]MDD5882169.1 recombination mediator RecR [Stecheria intestinalis]MDD6367246.1 recombination mediator RecR [Stecheria intestinalis]